MDIERLQQWWIAGQFKSKDRFEFYEMLILLLENGVQMKTALEDMYGVFSDEGRKPRNIIARVCRDCAIGLSEGRPFADVLFHWVSRDEFSLIQAGEASGKLAAAFSKARKVVENKQKVTKAVIGMTVYPSFLALSAAVLLNKISTDLVPKLGRGTNPETWDAPARTLKFVADMVTNHGILGIVLLLGLLVAIFGSLPVLRGRLRFYLDKVPPWSVYRMMHGSTFFQNIGVLLSSGVKLPDVLKMMKERSNPWMRERLDDALHGVNIGASLGEALHLAGHHFPDRRAVQMLRIISGKAGSESNLEDFGDRWMEQSVEKLQATAKIITAAALCLNGGIMLLVLIGASGMSDAMMNQMNR